jgi:hypothetical protein
MDLHDTLTKIINGTIECEDSIFRCGPLDMMLLFHNSKFVQEYVKIHNTLSDLQLKCTTDALTYFIDILRKTNDPLRMSDARFLIHYKLNQDPNKTLLLETYLEILFLTDYLDVIISDKMDTILKAIVNKCLRIYKENSINYSDISSMFLKYNLENKYFKAFHDVIYRQYFKIEFNEEIEDALKETMQQYQVENNKPMSIRKIEQLRKSYVDQLLGK